MNFGLVNYTYTHTHTHTHTHTLEKYFEKINKLSLTILFNFVAIINLTSREGAFWNVNLRKH